MKEVNQPSDLALNSQGFRDAISGFQNVKYSIRFTMVYRCRKSRSENIGDLKANLMDFHEK